jgi:hypothetical protein
MKGYDSLKERHLYNAMAQVAQEYVKGIELDKSDFIDYTKYNADWYYSIKFHKETGLVVSILGSEYENFMVEPLESEKLKYETKNIGKLTQDSYDIFSGYSMDVQDTFVRYDASYEVFTIFKIKLTCDGEYISAMDAYYSESGEFNISASVENLGEQLKESLLEGFYVKDMSKGEIQISGMPLLDGGYKTQSVKQNPTFKATVKNLDGDDSNQVLRVRVKFKGGDDVDMNPNTMTKYLMLLTKAPTEEEIKLWEKKVIRSRLN